MHTPLCWVVEGPAKPGPPVADLGYITEGARLGVGEGMRDFPEFTWEAVLRIAAARKA